MWFSGFYFLILSLIVEVYLWWKLQASLIFLSGRTCTIGGWLNTFLPHCICSKDSLQIYVPKTRYRYIYAPKTRYRYIYICSKDICSKDSLQIYIYIYMLQRYMLQRLVTDICSKDSLQIYVPKTRYRYMCQRLVTDICAKDSLQIYVPKTRYRYMRQRLVADICAKDS